MPSITSCLVVLSALLQLSLGKLPFPFAEDSSAAQTNPIFFNWTSIEPAIDLVYHDCYDRFKCARLIVPLDWQDKESRSLAYIAIIKLPSIVPVDHPTYAGGILTNPGGPGGSGINLARTNGGFLQWMADSESKHFDILSFDPRGVGETTPDAGCFPDPISRDLWGMKSNDEGLLDEGDHVITMKWARAHALGKMCALGNIGEHVGTAAVARDMLEIVEKMEEHRKRQLTMSASATGNNKDQSPLLNYEQDITSTAKLQYIGFSYGTVLGSTFASLYPDRVGRLILDGVVDAPDYMAQGWTTNLSDTEKILPKLYEYCFEAGPACPIYDSRGAGAIEEGVNKQLEDIRKQPIAAVDKDPWTLPPAIITHDLLRRLIFYSLYMPSDTFPSVVSLLAQLRKGNYGTMLQLINLDSYIHCPTGKKGLTLPVVGEAAQAIICGDGDSMSNQTRPEFEKYLQFLESQSPLAAPIWGEIRLNCIGWQVRAKWRHTLFGGNTSTPILWVSSTVDPVTPLRNAYKMSRLFPGSSVLRQDSEGHCGLFNHPSECTLGIIREYLDSGKLPDNGTKCPGTRRAWDGKMAATTEIFDEKYGGRLVPPAWKMSLGN